MSIFREIPPTAGFRLYVKDFLSLCGPRRYQGSLEEDFQQYLNVKYARVLSSGSAAFYIILEALKELSSKRTVVIPSYVCPLVPLAIKRAELKIEICDINSDNFDFDIRQLDNLCSCNPDILAIVPVHLGGIPVNFDAIQRIAAKYSIFTVEDCAQALGAAYGDKKVGTLGDFSFFSLARGKGLTIYEGGVIVSKRSEYAALLDDKIKQFLRSNFSLEALRFLELIGYWVFYRPRLFWFVFGLPQAFWNMQNNPIRASSEYYSVDFPVHKVWEMRKMLGHITFSRLENEIQKQRQKANYYIEGLKGISGIKIIKESPEAKANYPYLTVIFDDAAQKNRFIRATVSRGLGISWAYALAISDYDYLKPILPDKKYLNARDLAKNSLTLSTSAYLRPKDLDEVINTLKNTEKIS